MDIHELTRSTVSRDQSWLTQALQAAIELEFFTIPPYLTAMWSIIDQDDTAVGVLRSVIYEEMEHMALACNMLLAVGGQPNLNSRSAVPSYPNPLPGNVNPKLVVALRKFSTQVVDDFMAIEAPEMPVEFPAREAALAEAFSRIGELYTAIEDAFIALENQLPWNVDHQITGPLADLVITNLRDARNAIEKIRSQGEGSARRATGADGRIAHYYRFQQYQKRQRLEPDAAAPNGFVWGESLSFPQVFDMAEVPQGGYSYATASARAIPHLQAFDRAYALMLDHLQAAWSTSGQAALYLAIEQMFELQAPARALMQIPLPGRRQTYGPHFRHSAERSANQGELTMGFHVEINSILRSDEAYVLQRGSEHPFQKTGSRVFFDDIPIWLTANDWTARAEIRVVSQTRGAGGVQGSFRVLHVYDPTEATPLTRAFRRMFAGGTDPFIYLLMSLDEVTAARRAGVWDPRKAEEKFIHASSSAGLTRVANKHFDHLDEVYVAPLLAERIKSPIEWEPASDGELYPHVYGPINFDAAGQPKAFRKGADRRFNIVMTGER